MVVVREPAGKGASLAPIGTQKGLDQLRIDPAEPMEAQEPARLRQILEEREESVPIYGAGGP
jgi:hypothetical protein